jgi:hypothetical protein
MCRIIRVPAALDKVFRPLEGQFHGDHCTYFRLLGLAMAVMWGRRKVANLYRHLEVKPHRTRCHNFFLVERWEPEAALRQKVQERLRALRPGHGETRYWVLDDAKNATRGTAMDAVAKMKDLTTDASSRGHQDVCAILGARAHVMPVGIRLYVKKTPCPTVGVLFHTTTELAAPLLRECKPPAGVKGVVLCAAYDRCPTVVKACRAPQFHGASRLQSHRSLGKQGWTRKAGRDGRNRCRRRRTDTRALATPYGQVRYRFKGSGTTEWSTSRSSAMRSPSSPHWNDFESPDEHKSQST